MKFKQLKTITLDCIGPNKFNVPETIRIVKYTCFSHQIPEFCRDHKIPTFEGLLNISEKHANYFGDFQKEYLFEREYEEKLFHINERMYEYKMCKCSEPIMDFNHSYIQFDSERRFYYINAKSIHELEKYLDCNVSSDKRIRDFLLEKAL
uniref:Phage protein n=1 Tax=Rhabditophanes sp. KR3021 TaxID=114890 RepID=A0AC35TFT2_9BILA